MSLTPNFFEAIITITTTIIMNFKDDYDFHSGRRRGGERTFRVGPRRVGPRRVGDPKFRVFFPLPPQFSFILPSLGGLLVEFWWCLKRRGP